MAKKHMASRYRRRRRKQLNAMYGGRCFWCCQPMGAQSFTLDELLPRSRGGGFTLDNQVPAHRDCNMQRGNQVAPQEAFDRHHANIKVWLDGGRPELGIGSGPLPLMKRDYMPMADSLLILKVGKKAFRQIKMEDLQCLKNK